MVDSQSVNEVGNGERNAVATARPAKRIFRMIENHNRILRWGLVGIGSASVFGLPVHPMMETLALLGALLFLGMEAWTMRPSSDGKDIRTTHHG